MKKSPLFRALAVYGQIPGYFALTALLFILTNLGVALHLWLIGRAVNEVQAGHMVTVRPGAQVGDPMGLDFTNAWWWLALLGGLALARAAMQFGAQLMSVHVGQWLLSHIRERILVQIQRLDLAYHSRHGVGEMITRSTRDADKVRDALTQFWSAFFDTGLIIVTCVGLLCWFSPWLGLVPLAFVAAGVAMLMPQMDRLVALDQAVGGAYDAVNQDLSEGVHGVRVIKAFALEEARVQGFASQVDVFIRESRNALLFAARNLPIPQLTITLSHGWVLGYGAYLISVGQLSFGELVAALLAANNMVVRTEQVGQMMRIFADARSSAARLWELFDAEPEILPGTATLPAGPLALRLDGVSVAAPDGGRHVLRDVSFTVRPGEIVALVGATGTGKSVLMGLLPRLVEADVGAVLIGSPAPGAGRGGAISGDPAAAGLTWTDVRELRTDDLRRRVHVLPQESFLYSDTLAANLRIAAPDATDDDLRHALNLAAADELLSSLAQGLETRIGDRGTTLSGGQRQRVCLARALLARATILGLDDATSALDAATENMVLRNIRSFRTVAGAPAASGGAPASSSITMLIVSSKLSTILMADRVLLLADGRIAAQGTHEELSATSAAYRELMGIGEDDEDDEEAAAADKEAVPSTSSPAAATLSPRT
ncbi:ABC transporter ATP-binding protein [Verrucomicrobia bacterium LW23]|nr:ABC transporter ATP-binding protein [Verrucomicrobia bacterium LW23]